MNVCSAITVKMCIALCFSNVSHDNTCLLHKKRGSVDIQVAIVATSWARYEQVREWLAYHRTVGVSHFYLFIDTDAGHLIEEVRHSGSMPIILNLSEYCSKGSL